ncbi:MAG: hypothetical protein IJT44_11165 [Clostridia bacterium]|nr:hypothetical protein [Clostridia bacterium]
MKMKKLFALCTAAVLVLSMTACGGKETKEPDTTAAEIVTESLADESTTLSAEAESLTEDASATEAVTDEAASEKADATEAASEAEATTEADAKKTPETVEEIVEFYKQAATTTNKGKINANDKMELKYLDGGSGLVGGLISAFEPIAKNALAKNSGPIDHVTGGFDKLTADDVASATAKSDGKYTTIRINLKDQTDGMYGKSKEGHVGHGVSILDGVQKAIDELDGVSVDASEGEIKLHYNNAYIDAKIDNDTGKIVSGKWHYIVDVSIDNTKVKVGPIPATLKGATGQVEYAVTL